MMNATLTANIKYNGVTVQTLTKSGVYAYTGFKGIYTSSFGSGQYTAPNPIFTASNSSVTIFSPSLISATVSHSGDITPTNWSHSGNRLDAGIPSSGSALVVNVACQNGENYTIPIIRSNLPLMMSVNFDGESMIITLDEADEYALENHPWAVEIRNASTGVLMATLSSTNRSVTISNAGWPKGIYVVKVTIGKEVLTEKVVVK